MKSNVSDIPKIFWKYFDLYRRKKITLEQYIKNTGIKLSEVKSFLKVITEKTSEIR